LATIYESVTETSDQGASFNSQWQRTYTRTFRVVLKRKAGPITVSRAKDPSTGLAVPRVGDYYSFRGDVDRLSFCQQLEPKCESEDGLQWLVTAGYGPFDAQQMPENPMDQPIRVNWGFAEFQKVAVTDIEGAAIVNSAGERFTSAAEIEDSRPVLSITRNEPTFDPAVAAAYKDAINTDTFFGGDPGTWKVVKLDGDLTWSQNAGWYYVVNYEFQFNPENWLLKIDDNGLRETSDDGSLIPIVKKDASGKAIWPCGPVTDPCLLDGQGKQLGEGASPVILTFHVRKELAFQDLGLDPAGAPGQGLG
jgi:hypothetical protein